jgi:adenine-specific DNA-methyltransferase
LRNFLFRESRIKAVHLFDSRTKTFKEDKVLQETVIFKTSNNEGTLTEISVSNGLSDLDEAKSFKYQITDLVDINSENKILHLPKNDDDFQLIQKIKRLQFRLSDHNIKVSTGRVVAFRSKSFISKSENVLSVPLIWGDNIKEQLLCWPLKSSKREQYISSEAGNLLIPSANYVVQRRFSAKEDKKRLICAPLLKSNFKFELIGLENKTNFFYKVNSRFTDEQVYGLSTLLNSSIYDSYFRMINGNINVSATEMRLLPLPSLEVIERLGKRMIGRGLKVKEIDDLVDEIVFTENLILEVA